MTDERLRGLERAWLASGQDADAEAYIEALRRAGAPERAIHRVQGRWGTPGRYTAEEILGQLDAQAAAFDFPVLDNGYVYPADVRLRAFRDPARWAVIVEQLGFSPRAGTPHGLQVVTYAFGNCLDGEPGAADGDFHAPIADPADGPLADEDTGELVHPETRELRIRGQVVPIPTDPDHYAARGIEPMQPPAIALFELLRALLPEHRQALLATDAEARRRLPADLPPFLTLDEWRHPDVVSGETPGQSSTFQRLAAALVAGDPDAYVPPDEPNTHWRHWPGGGTL